jgi:hypothetical protein
MPLGNHFKETLSYSIYSNTYCRFMQAWQATVLLVLVIVSAGVSTQPLRHYGKQLDGSKYKMDKPN